MHQGKRNSVQHDHESTTAGPGITVNRNQHLGVPSSSSSKHATQVKHESGDDRYRVSQTSQDLVDALNDFIYQVYNEPTQGLFYVNRHLMTVGSRLIESKQRIDGMRIKLQTSLTDLLEDIECVNKILKSQLNLDGISSISPLKLETLKDTNIELYNQLKYKRLNNSQNKLLQQLRHEMGYNRYHNTSNNDDINNNNNKNDKNENNMQTNANTKFTNKSKSNEIENDDNSDTNSEMADFVVQDGIDDLGFGEFLHISDMISLSRSLFTDIYNMQENDAVPISNLK